MTHPVSERFSFLTERPSADHPAFNCPADKLLEVANALRDELGYPFLMDVTGIDWSEEASPRFTGVYHFLSPSTHEYLRLAVDCADDESPTLPSLANLFPAADWHERETFDMLGIVYEGHPNLKRILMWDDYPFHPLRKEFPLAGIDVPLPSPDIEQATGASVLPAPMMGGPFVARPQGAMSKKEPRAKDESWTEVRPKP